MRPALGQSRLFWAGCLLLVLLASVAGRPDIPIDETRYVSVAWEMWSGGDWLVMHKNGLPYHHKPPLLFWLIGLGWGVFGVNDWWPRAISALFSFACLGLTAAIARRLWPHSEAVGERAGWLLLGGTFWLFFSTSVIFDILLAACVLLALLAALRAWQGEERGTWGLFGLALGLGILAKGPVALLHVLPALLAAPWWGGGRQRCGRAWYGRLGLGVLLGAAIALAWAIPAAVRGGEEFRNAIFWGQTAGRVSGTLAHKQPFWFYLAVLPLLLFPWFFWGRCWRALAAAWRQRGDAGVRFCLAWIAPAFVVFSLAGGKQAHYLLPLLPAVALLLAAGWPERGGAGRWSALPLALAVALLGLVFVAHPAWAPRLWLASFADNDWRLAGVLLLVVAAAALMAGRGDHGPRGMALLSAGLVAVLLLGVLRPLSPVFDMTPLAGELKRLEEQGVPVAHASAYNDQYQFYGRLLRPLQEIGRADVARWLAAHPQGRVVAYLRKPGEVAAVQPLFAQPYLDGAAVLLDREAAGRMAGEKP